MKIMLFILDYQPFHFATFIVFHEYQMKELAFHFHFRSEGDPFKGNLEDYDFEKSLFTRLVKSGEFTLIPTREKIISRWD